MAKKRSGSKTITNRRARHDYVLDDSLLVGIILTGAETKALRMGHGQLVGAYVIIKEGELWLMNAIITGTGSVPIEEAYQSRSRKLLAKKREIAQLNAAKQSGLTIIPLDILTKGRYIKLRIAAARGKKLYDKRANLKKRDHDRQISSALKSTRMF